MIRIIFISFFCLVHLYSLGQQQNTDGKMFVLTFPKIDIAPENSQLWGPQVTQLRITSMVNTKGQVSNPNTGYSQSFTVNSGTTTTVVVPRTQCMDSVYETVQNNGLIVTADDDVSIFAISAQNFTSDVSNLIPLQSLGIKYVVSSYFSKYLATGRITNSEFAIVASVDSTSIEIIPGAGTTEGHAAHIPFSISLNKGQSYNVASQSGDLTGSFVSVSNGCKPIAVFSGNDVGFIPDSIGTGDYLFEQLFPISALGKEFIVANMKGNNASRVKIVAAYDNTQIRINDSVAGTLNKGQHHEFEIMAPLTGIFFHPGGFYLHATTDTSNNLYITGNYHNSDGHFYISKWDGNNWTHLLGSGAGALNVLSPIRQLICDTAGNLYVIGQDEAGTDYFGMVAKWNGVAWTRLGSFPVNNFPESISIGQSGKIYVAVNPWPNGGGKIFSWTGSGWVEVGSGASALNANGAIRSITSDGLGNLYAAGSFTNSSGLSYVAKWNGSSWSEVGISTFFTNRYVAVIKSDANGNIYATVSSNGSISVAKWDGTNWSLIRNKSDIGIELSMDWKGNIYVWGPNGNIIRWNGTAWVELGKGARGLMSMGTNSASIDAIAAHDTNSVYAVGEFFFGAAWWKEDRWVEAAKFSTPQQLSYFVSTSKPVQVMQYATGKYYKFNTVPYVPGDPTMLTVTPLEQLTHETVFSLPEVGSIMDHYLNITVNTADVFNTYFDGVNIGAKFIVVPSNPVYSLAQVDATPGTHHLKNPGGFTAAAYGFGWSQGYGFNIGSNAERVNNTDTSLIECPVIVQTNNCSNSTFNIFPNPFTNELKVQHSCHSVFDFALFNALGQKVYFHRLASNQTMYFPSPILGPGIYFFCLYDLNGKRIKVGKLVKL